MEALLIYYGIQNQYIDVTSIAFEHCLFNNNICIPSGDHSRTEIFGDPLPHILKHIKIIHQDKEHIVEANVDVLITPDGLIDPNVQLKKIHESLKFVGGKLTTEYPEQLMSTMFIPKNAKVLELGSNIGRNTLIISSLLEDKNNLVTMECDPNTCTQLKSNLERNNFKIKIEDAALSKRKLFQRNWNTYTENEAPRGSKEVKTITFSDLVQKHQVDFDTIVADCEGALYNILLDDPKILDNIKLFIVENDYNDILHKNAVDQLLIEKGFTRIYVKSGPWGPCKNNFYEVWAKKNNESSIPFFVISFNNGFFVKNTVRAIRKFAQSNQIHIIDNASSSKETLTILDNLEKEKNVQVERYSTNKGPWTVLRDPEYGQIRKNPFILTDPDLDLSKLPTNTLEILIKIQHNHKSRQVGLALDISQPEDLLEGNYLNSKSIYQWEQKFWKRPIQKDIYSAPIDTTFCLYDLNYPSKSIRLAGNFTVKHLPWHKSFIDTLSMDQIRETFLNHKISTTTKLILDYISSANIYWCCAGKNGKNFGDILTPYIYKKITGKECQRKTPGSTDDKIFFGAGSIMSNCNTNNIIIWGTGVMFPNEKFKKPAKVLSVRGPITRKRFLELGYPCPEKYGDIGLILPRFYNPSFDKKYKLGIIPHYVDYVFCKKLFGKHSEVNIIDLCVGVEPVVDQLVQCEYTISSSLHGIIASHAYGIKCGWVRFSEKIAGKFTKYHDYYGSVNITENIVPKYITEHLDPDLLIEHANDYPNPNFPIPTDHIMEICPWK
jgi:FkbM family methyltransferase